MTEERQYLTLCQLQQQVRATLSERFALPVWVCAEISELKVNYSGHCYLELVEKGEGDGVARAQARAVIWRSAYARLSTRFGSETGQRLGAGMKILARVAVSYHELYGFSLQIVDLDATFTLGDMERRRQQTIARLQEEGVWEMNRETLLPPALQRIAVVSSRNAAGYQDFCKELGKSRYAFRIDLYDAFMQGAEAEDTIVAALDEIARAADRYDAVVIIRGGGSASDLNCFNAYRLCAHIAQFPLPVITGIGHDKDTSVADMVAHTALKTPTAVAVWLEQRMAQVEGWFDTAAAQLGEAAVRLTRDGLLRCERLRGDLEHLSAALLERRRRQTDDAARMLPEAALNMLEQARRRLAAADDAVSLRAPRNILRLGFSIVRCAGSPVTAAAQVAPGRQLDIETFDGTIRARVEES